ncbi:MAG: discoidin domain-containing protein, partial [Planctomycetota bacterium]
MCKKLIYWASLVLVLGLAADIASGDVLVLLDFEGTDTWTDNWDTVQVTETSDAPDGSMTASTWEIPGDDGDELVRHWVPPLDLSAYSYFNFYMKVTADLGAGSGTWLGVEGDEGGSGIWIEPLSDVPGFTVGEWFYVSIPFTTLLEDTWDTFPTDYSEVSVLVFWFESWSGAGFNVSIDYVTVSDTPEEGLISAGPGRTEILTFSDLDEGGEIPVADDYQPPELEGTGITVTWTDWDQFNDDIQGEGLRDHTETWDPAVTSVYIYTGDVGGTIEFSSAVEVPSIWIFQDSWASTAVAGHLGGQEIWSVPADHPEQWVEITEGAGHKIDSIVAVGGFSRIDDITIVLGDSHIATDPSPAHEAIDMPLDGVVLSWGAGDFANEHDVYFGTNFNDVRNATKADPEYKATKSLGDESYTLGHLDLGTDYFWRIDEVNAPPNQSTVFKGVVWRFTTEAVGYPIADVTATASSSAAGQGPENTINGSGLDEDDKHSTTSTDMWLSAFGGSQPSWIQYEFDKAYALHELWVWNSNQMIEPSLGVGIMDVTIEYSQDGETWTKLDDARFNQAPGDDSYTANTTVDMKGVMAQFVKLTAQNNFMSILEQYGLSEVRFFYIPVSAREPDPQDGATDVHPDVILGWRPGRQAATHDVYLNTDEQAVIDGTVDAVT